MVGCTCSSCRHFGPGDAQAAMTTKDNLPAHRLADSPVRPPACASIEVTEEHHIAKARQACRALACEIGFSSVEACYVETSVSELAVNLFSHTDRGGVIAIHVIEDEKGLGIEIVSEDEGPGITDLKSAMEDGFSTNGGLGCGLPGVKRLMDEFDIKSQPGLGTKVVARKWIRRR